MKFSLTFWKFALGLLSSQCDSPRRKLINVTNFSILTDNQIGSLIYVNWYRGIPRNLSFSIWFRELGPRTRFVGTFVVCSTRTRLRNATSPDRNINLYKLVPRETEKSEFLNLVDFGDVAFSVESAIRIGLLHTH